MGGTSKTESTHSSKKDYSHYADIPTSPSDDTNSVPQAKPRLIIIHPLDINTSGVEVLPSPTSPVSPSGISHKKPPVPPCRSDSTKLEANKPNRPPPPKNSIKIDVECELPKLNIGTKSPADSVYANLGEVRSSIAPRKPERTNSMREREAKALELQRRQPVGESLLLSRNVKDDDNNKHDDDVFIEDHAETLKNEDCIIAKPILKATLPINNNNNANSANAANANAVESFNDRKKKIIEIENVSTRSKIELFENNALKSDIKSSPLSTTATITTPITSSKSPSPSGNKTMTFFLNNDGLKSSVHKMNMTIDSYLKNKKLMSSSDSNLLDSRSPTPPQQIVASTNDISPPPNKYSLKNGATNIELRGNAYEPINVNVNIGGKLSYQRASYPDNGICTPSPVLTFGN
jgi:hypothetical protein